MRQTLFSKIHEEMTIFSHSKHPVFFVSLSSGQKKHRAQPRYPGENSPALTGKQDEEEFHI